MRLLVTPAALAFVISAGPCLAQTTPPDTMRSAREGVYTADQAARGRSVYRQICADCHATSEFTGHAFLSVWANQSAFSMFRLISDQMPLDSPGSLRPQQYADVIAYILQRNGLPAGPRELPAEEAELRRITIEPPPPPEN